MRQIFAT